MLRWAAGGGAWAGKGVVGVVWAEGTHAYEPTPLPPGGEGSCPWEGGAVVGVMGGEVPAYEGPEQHLKGVGVGVREGVVREREGEERRNEGKKE